MGLRLGFILGSCLSCYLCPENSSPMKTFASIALSALLATSLAGQTKASAAGAWKAPASRKIYAQKLVEDTMEKHPDLLIFVYHVTPPGRTVNVIVASNIGRI